MVKINRSRCDAPDQQLGLVFHLYSHLMQPGPSAAKRRMRIESAAGISLLDVSASFVLAFVNATDLSLCASAEEHTPTIGIVENLTAL